MKLSTGHLRFNLILWIFFVLLNAITAQKRVALVGDTLLLEIDGSSLANIQWQERSDSFEIWQNIAGANTMQYRIVVTAGFPETKYYRPVLKRDNDPCFQYGSILEVHIKKDASELEYGDFYAGGLYYHSWLDTLLIVSYQNIGKQLFGCKGKYLNGKTKPDLGSGKNNTQVILQNCSDKNIAAYACDTFTGSGYSDWFLPSVDELYVLNNVRNHLYLSEIYLSSTEENADYAAGVFFKDYYKTVIYKDVDRLVHPVRYQKAGMRTSIQLISQALDYGGVTDIACRLIPNEPTNAELLYTGIGQDSDVYEWNFGQGEVLSGNGRGPYKVHFNFGGYNIVMLKNLSDSCSNRIAQSHFFRVKLFEDIKPGLPAFYNGVTEWGDLNQDGFPDILVSGEGRSKLYKNLGNDHFDEYTFTLPPLGKSCAAFSDFDADGLLDFALSGLHAVDSIPQLYLYKNTGQDSFVLIKHNLPGLLNGFIAWADIDCNGSQELYLSGETKDGEPFGGFFKYVVDSGFVLLPQKVRALKNSEGRFADYNKDGFPDLLITGSDTSGRYTLIYKNDKGIFTEHPQKFVGVNWGSVDWGDYNGDGWLDFAYSGCREDVIVKKDATLIVDTRPAATLFIFASDGNGNFMEKVNFNNRNFYRYCFSSNRWGDFDNDGDLDLLVVGVPGFQASIGGTGGQIGVLFDPRSAPRIFRNDGNNNFVPNEANIPAEINLSTIPPRFGLPARFFTSYCSVEDFNLDGRLDILREGNGASIDYDDGENKPGTVYKNVCLLENLSPTIPKNLNATPSCNSVELKWNISTDDHTPTGSIYYEIYLGTDSNRQNIISKAARNKVYKNQHIVYELPPGNYYWRVRAIDQAFSKSEFSEEHSFTISPKPEKPEISRIGNSLQSSADSNNQWYDEQGIIVGETGQIFEPKSSGKYYCIVAINGCSSDTSNVIEFVLSKVDEKYSLANIIVYPNPTNGIISLKGKFNWDNINISIQNILGVEILKLTSPVTPEITLPELPAGVYIFILQNDGEFKTLTINKI